jgi:hypothetical protein
MATNTKSPVLAHHVTSVDALNTLFEQRFAPVTFTVPDYENSVVEVRMLNAGEEEHASSFAREPDGSRNNDRYMRMYVAYGMVNPLLAEDRDARVQAEKIAAILERAPSDWISPIFRQIWDMTYEYTVKRMERQRRGGVDGPTFFPKPASAPASSQTD